MSTFFCVYADVFHTAVFFTKLSMLRRFCRDSSAMVRLSLLPVVSPLCRADMKPTTLPPLQLNPPSGESLNLESGCALIKDPRRGPRQENKPRPSLSPPFCHTIMIRAVCPSSDLHGSGVRCECALQHWRRGFVIVSRVFRIVCLFVLTSKMGFFL